MPGGINTVSDECLRCVLQYAVGDGDGAARRRVVIPTVCRRWHRLVNGFAGDEKTAQERELRRVLCRRSFGKADIDAAIAGLRGQGYGGITDGLGMDVRGPGVLDAIRDFVEASRGVVLPFIPSSACPSAPPQRRHSGIISRLHHSHITVGWQRHRAVASNGGITAASQSYHSGIAAVPYCREQWRL